MVEAGANLNFDVSSILSSDDNSCSEESVKRRGCKNQPAICQALRRHYQSMFGS